MTELNDSGDLALYSSAVLYILSAVTPPKEYITTILDIFVRTIKSSTVSGKPLRLSDDRLTLPFTLVMEDSPQCTPTFGSIFLPKSSFHFSGEHFISDGSITGLSSG